MIDILQRVSTFLNFTIIMLQLGVPKKVLLQEGALYEDYDFFRAKIMVTIMRSLF